MAFNLLDAVRGYLTPDLVDKAGSQLGEPAAGVRTALTVVVPAVLALFVKRTEKGDAQGLLQDAKEAANSDAITHPQDVSGGGGVHSGGWERLQGMFAGGFGGIGNSIAQFAGIKSGSAERLLSMVAPLALAVLGRHATENNLSPSGLAAFLSAQKSSILGALPAGISQAFLSGDPLGSGNAAPAAGHAAHGGHGGHGEHAGHGGHGHHAETVEGPVRTNWSPWLISGLIILAVLIFLNRGCFGDDTAETTGHETAEGHTAPADPHHQAPAATATGTSGREQTSVTLSDGVTVTGYRGGVEDQLVACLNDAGCTAGKEKWFDFDNINFETGSARLTAASQAQVQNIAAILKAYPKAKIKIGGYTDKTGNDAANKELSQQRADAVLNAIKSAGAPAGQLSGAEGYGSAFAKVPATASDEERRPDRRISVQLREK